MLEKKGNPRKAAWKRLRKLILHSTPPSSSRYVLLHAPSSRYAAKRDEASHRDSSMNSESQEKTNSYRSQRLANSSKRAKWPGGSTCPRRILLSTPSPTNFPETQLETPGISWFTSKSCNFLELRRILTSTSPGTLASNISTSYIKS